MAAPPIASTPSMILASPVALATRCARSSPSTITMSAPSAFSSSASSARRTTLTVRRPRCLGEHDQQPADRRVGDVLDHPVAGLEIDEVGQHEQRRRRIDAHHRRLLEIDAGRQRDRIVALHLAALGPVLALQVDDEIALLHVLHRGADGGDPADALGARRRRQGRLQPITAPAEPHVGRVDGKGQDVEHDFVGAGIADVRHVGAARDVPRRSVTVDQHLLHAAPPDNPSGPLCWPVDCLYCDSARGEMPDGGQGI